MEKSHISIGFLDISPVGKLWARQASNLQPTDYEAAATPREHLQKRDLSDACAASVSRLEN